jgi:hypothetical protein
LNKNRTARCLCEKSAITVVGEPELVAVCNCLSCQRQFGSAFGWVAYFKESSVISKSENPGSYKRYTDTGNETHYSFCKDCGSTLWWHATYLPNLIGTAAGCFAEHDFPPPSISVWEQTKRSWVKFPLFILPFSKQLPSLFSSLLLVLKLPKLASLLMSLINKPPLNNHVNKQVCGLMNAELLKKNV